MPSVSSSKTIPTERGRMYLGLLYPGVYVVAPDGRLAKIVSKVTITSATFVGKRLFVKVEYVKSSETGLFPWRTLVHYCPDYKSYVVSEDQENQPDA